MPASTELWTTSRAPSNETTRPMSRTIPVNTPERYPYGSCTYALSRTSSPTARASSRVSSIGARQADDHPLPLAGQPGRLEDEELVHEIVLEERGGERRASLEQEGLHAVRTERRELLLEWPAPQLELGSLRQRAPAECDPARLTLRRRNVARVEPRVVPADRPHPDGDRVRVARAARARGGATLRRRSSASRESSSCRRA